MAPKNLAQAAPDTISHDRVTNAAGSDESSLEPLFRLAEVADREKSSPNDLAFLAHAFEVCRSRQAAFGPKSLAIYGVTLTSILSRSREMDRLKDRLAVARTRNSVFSRYPRQDAVQNNDATVDSATSPSS